MKKFKHAKSTSVDLRLKKSHYHPPSKLIMFDHAEKLEDKEIKRRRFAQ